MPRPARTLCAALGAALLSSAFAAAAAERGGVDPDAPLEQFLFRELGVVTTATRTERSLADSPAAVSVITAQDIRMSGATSLTELLATHPGIDLLRLSNSDAAVSLRGFNDAVAPYLLVMIDGRSVYLDFFGIVLWDDLNVALQEIERIEIVRGPGSVLYGANALLGTVHILTKRPRDLPRAYARVGAGNRSRFATATAAQTSGRLGLKTSIEYLHRDHFRSEAQLDPSGVHRRDDTSLRARKWTGALDVQLDGGAELRLSGGLSRTLGDTLTALGTYAHDGSLWHAQLNYRRGPWRLQSFFSQLDFDIHSVPTALPLPAPRPQVADRLVSNSLDLELQREVVWGRHTLLLGAATRRLMTDSPFVLDGREAETRYASFAQDEIRLSDRITAYLGARVDDHPKSGTHVSPRASLVVKLGESERVRLSYARAFRDPSIVASYADLALHGGLFTVMGNQDLDPTWITSYEAGFKGCLHPRVTGTLDLFFTVLEDFQDLAITAVGPPTMTEFRNLGRTRAWGGELELEFGLARRVRGFVGYAFQNATGPGEGAMPRHKAHLGLRGALTPELTFSVSGRWVSRYSHEPGAVGGFPEPRVPSHLLVDAHLSYQVTPRLRIGLQGRNLFHQVRRQYPVGDEIGSEWLLSGSLQF